MNLGCIEGNGKRTLIHVLLMGFQRVCFDYIGSSESGKGFSKFGCDKSCNNIGDNILSINV